MKRTLISVYDKTGVVGFAKALADMGYEIVSTGKTEKALREAGAPVLGISDATGFPECFDGRLKTLHPKIHGGILAMRQNESHMRQARELGIPMIDIVVNNLYPFESTVAREGVTFAEAVEEIDIGGPAMLRAAAKNWQDVAAIVDPADYEAVVNELASEGRLGEKTRKRLMLKVYRHTAAYDAAIAKYLGNEFEADSAETFPDRLVLSYTKSQEMRYGENPHQKAAFYAEAAYGKSTLANTEQLHGRELSFCNINDAHGALELVREFTEPALVACKHSNPCGVGCGADIYEAYIKAYTADPVSIHGGIIAANREIDAKTAAELGKLLIDIVIAPGFTEEAAAILKKKKNIRLLRLADIAAKRPGKSLDIKKVSGGVLVQETDDILLPDGGYRCVTVRKPSVKEGEDMLFAWKIVKYVKSNAIVIGRGGQSLGIGVGQVSRIWAARQAVEHCVEALGPEILVGAVMASDAFFPFEDCVETAAAAGVTAIIQPGGSVNDQKSIDACDKYGISMVFTEMRHFRH